MKKISILFLLAIFATSVSYGQLAIGVRLGYNGNKLTTNLDSIKDQFNSGFHFGAWARIGKRLYFAPELLYSMSGGVFTKEGNLSTTGWKQKITVGSLDVPLLVGLKIIHSDVITWRVELGPEAAFVINKKISDDGLTPPITTSDINNLNWFILGGTGIDFLFLSFDIRYQYGFCKLIKDAGSYSFDTKNQVVVATLGFKIFGKK